MFDGHIMGERDPAKTDEKELGMLMAGMTGDPADVTVAQIEERLAYAGTGEKV